MDSWESARHNPYEYDELELELKAESEINFLFISTKYHFGNQVQFVKILAKQSKSDKYEVFLDKTPLEGHAELKIALDFGNILWKDFKIQIFPDGGISRLGLYKELPKVEATLYKKANVAKCIISSDIIPETQKPMSIDVNHLGNFELLKESNYASLAFGAKVISATDEHYAPAYQVLSPFRPIDMFDGLESKRSRVTGHFEEVVFELADSIDIGRVVLDFTHFVNNNPLEIKVDYEDNGSWSELIALTNVKAFAGNKKSFDIKENMKAKKLRLIARPDGGINRILVFSK
jgi:allantoicase